ncbi:hypothetical protein [Streptomyces sp. LN325]|uniref:hypothetical protein n=1 Tax=Streptomyces sp. LN325 TaxID=3112976 RepID=UPI00371C59C7
MTADPTVRSLLGGVGVWSMELRSADRPEVREAAAELDELGFPALWIPGLDGGGVLDDAGHLLAAAPPPSRWGCSPSGVRTRRPSERTSTGWTGHTGGGSSWASA